MKLSDLFITGQAKDMFGKKKNQFFARYKDIVTQYGNTKEIALDKLINNLDKQLNLSIFRRYYWSKDKLTCFCLYYCNGSYCYDIVRDETGYPCTTMLSGDYTETQAIESVKRHVESY